MQGAPTTLLPPLYTLYTFDFGVFGMSAMSTDTKIGKSGMSAGMSAGMSGMSTANDSVVFCRRLDRLRQAQGQIQRFCPVKCGGDRWVTRLIAKREVKRP